MRVSPLLLLSGLLTGAIAAPAAAQPAPSSLPPVDRHVIHSTGEGTIKRAPDRAWFTVTAESRARTPQAAQKQNAQIMSAVLDKLRGAGLPQDAIQTRSYDLQPEYDFNDGRQTLRGYAARNTVEVRADDLARVGELLDIAVSAGATSAGQVRFDLKEREAAEREALRLAVQDARRRAEAMASAAGLNIASILRIDEQRSGGVPPPMPLMMEMRMAQSADSAPPVAPGELEVRAHVSLLAEAR